MRLILGVAAALLALPGASACSYAAPSALQDLAWAPDGTLLGRTDVFARGAIDLESATVRSEWPDPSFLSPDMRFVVFARSGPDVQTGPMILADSCDGHLSRHLVAFDRETATFSIVERGPIWGMGASDEGVHAFDGQEMRVLEWGTWRMLRSEAATGIVEPLRWRGVVTLTPDGRATFDYATGSLRALGGERVHDLGNDSRGVRSLAFSPEGAFAAVEVEIDDGTHELRVFRLAERELIARERMPVARRAWAWGPEGLAWIAIDHAVPDVVALSLWPGAPGPAERVERSFNGTAGGLAWSPDGGALALSFPKGTSSASLQLLDARLDVEKRLNVTIAPSTMAAFYEKLRALDVPSYTLEEMERAAPPGRHFVPFPSIALALVVALAISLPSRGTWRALRR